jgi:hypothetical protein
MRKRRTKPKSVPQRPTGRSTRQLQVEEAFNPRDYLLTTPRDHEQEDGDFDPREWFLLDAAQPETEEARLRRLLGAGFPELELHTTEEAGAFDFRYRIEDPETYSTEQVHDYIVTALERIGRNVVFTQIATQLAAGMTSGTFWITGD